MALRTPPSWLQQGSHPAENDRLTTQAIFSTTGIIGSTSMAVTAQGSPNMTVNVAAGWAAIVGTTQSNMGTYVAYNDATTVLTITTAPTSNSRIDRVVATVNDAYYSGSTNNVTFTVIAGTVAASPVAPATPANSISLATIAVGTNVTSITSGNITNTRVATTTNIIDTSSFVTTTGVATLTNKTLTAPVISTVVNSGTLTLPTSTDTLVGRATTDTLTNKFLTSPVLQGSALETITQAGAFNGYTFYVTTNGAIQFLGSNATGNGAVNITSTAGQTLNAIVGTNQSITVTMVVQNGGSAFAPSTVTVDGAAPAVLRWAGGTAPVGNANSYDVYTFTLIKLGTPSWVILASQTKFA